MRIFSARNFSAFVVCCLATYTVGEVAAQSVWSKIGSAVTPVPAIAAPRDLPPPSVVNLSEMEIPFSVSRVPAGDAKALVSVFVSWDEGKTWNHFRDVEATAGKFRFRVKQDKEFWFITQLMTTGKQVKIPPGSRPQLRVVVDTQKPELKVVAIVNGSGKAELSWQMADPHLDVNSLKLEYQDAIGASNPWLPITVDSRNVTVAAGKVFGKAFIQPQVASNTINIRAEVADTAGNKQIFSQQLILPTGNPGKVASPQLVASPPSGTLASDPSALKWPENNLVDSSPLNDPPAMLANPHVRPGRLAGSSRSPNEAGELLAPRNELRNGSSTADQDLEPVMPQGKPSESQKPLPDLKLPPAETELPRTPATSPPAIETIPAPVESLAPVTPLPVPRSQPALPENDLSLSPPPAESFPAGDRPRLSNSRRFTLDYDIESVGPEGVKEVELWGTNDGGKTWNKWGADPDKTSPMEVEVNGEADYGFRVVIVGNNGLEGNKPQRGDTADIWIGIDVTKPTAKILSAAYGEGENAGKLDIRWDAADAHLGQRPITLAFSDRPDGRYSVIAAGLPNSGQYLWQFDPRSPKQVFLRLEVRDEAGNITIDQLSEPIKVEGLAPQGRIRSVTPAAEIPRGAFRSPLFR